MRVVGYAYPWDYLDDPSAAERVASLRLDGVALAASYHACRVASPLHPSRRVFAIPGSACYVPVRHEVWSGQRIKPRPPTWLVDDAYTSAARALRDAGVTSEAWIVLNHVDGLTEVGDYLARNAFGDVYPYALCPSSEEVRAYGRTLIDEIVLATEAPGVVLEALGPMGFEHHDVHDKTDLADFTRTTEQLLSLCFCEHCLRGYVEAGLDTTELAERVRRGVKVEAISTEEALGSEFDDAVTVYRANVVGKYLGEILGALATRAKDTKVTLHASATPWTTGSFCALSGGAALEGVTTVANCWDRTTAIAEVRELRALVGTGGRVGGYWQLGRDDRHETTETITSLRAAGMDELHLYHLGLVGQHGLDAARELAREAHSLSE